MRSGELCVSITDAGAHMQLMVVDTDSLMSSF